MKTTGVSRALLSLHNCSVSGVLPRIERGRIFRHGMLQDSQFGAHNREVITLTEPQVWTLIGVFSAAIFGVLTFGFSALRSEIRSSINGLRGELDGLRGEMDGLRAEMRSGFDAVNQRIDYLDRDVQYLMRKEFGDSPSQ